MTHKQKTCFHRGFDFEFFCEKTFIKERTLRRNQKVKFYLRKFKKYKLGQLYFGIWC